MVVTKGHFPGERIQQGAVSLIEGERIVHWELNGAIYHVVLHLGDSVPSEQLSVWREARRQFAVRRAENPDGVLLEDEIAELRRVYDERIEKYLSSGYGCCALREPVVADAMRRVLEFGNGTDYDLHMVTIMPNHVHVIVGARGEGASGTVQEAESTVPDAPPRRETTAQFSVQAESTVPDAPPRRDMVTANTQHVKVGRLRTMKEIIDQWKSVSAHRIVKLSAMKSPIWQPDHYSRIIRTPEEYKRQAGYVWNNPENAGLGTGFWRKRY